MKATNLFLLLAGVFALFFLFAKKSNASVIAQPRGVNSLATNNTSFGSGLLLGSLSGILGNIPTFNNSAPSSTPSFLGGGSPSILNVDSSSSAPDFSGFSFSGSDSGSSSLLGDLGSNSDFGSY